MSEYCSPSGYPPHLFGSVHYVVGLLPLILLSVLFQIFLLLFKFIPFGFLCLWACRVQNHHTHPPEFDESVAQVTIFFVWGGGGCIPSSVLLWSSDSFLFFVIFPSVGFCLKNFFGPPFPPGFVKGFFLSELWGLKGRLPTGFPSGLPKGFHTTWTIKHTFINRYVLTGTIKNQHPFILLYIIFNNKQKH